MIASSSCTLRASSSKSACKSWNFFKFKSYSKIESFDKHGGLRGLWMAGQSALSWVLGPCPPPHFDDFPKMVCVWGVDVLKSLNPRPTPFKPDPTSGLYSPCIPIIVSRIKTLSAKIFRASRIWCIPSPCGDRYSRHGIEHTSQTKRSPRCKVILLIYYINFISLP